MKFLHSAVSVFLLTVAAAAQSAAPAPPATAPKPSAPMQITSLGGDAVKGPEHPLTLDQMKVLYVAMGYDKAIDQNIQSLIASQKARAPFIPVTFWDDVETSFKKIDYPTVLLGVYKQYLSVDDAAKVIDFSKTDAGKHFLASIPDSSREAAMAIQREQQTAGKDVQARHKDELDAAFKKYQEEHQPKPAPSLSSPTQNPPSGSGATTAPATPPASTTPKN